jgi:dephospho-CoA kinase
MLNSLLKIAVTGGVGTGKSTVCRYFKKFNASVVSADKLVHRIISSKTSTGQKIIRLFSTDILENGKISRKKIAKIVFNDKKKLRKLERIVHPIVFEEIEKLYAKAKLKNYNFFVVEIPLLFETKKEKYFDYIITVTADEKTCKKRVKGLLKKDFEKRVKRQIPLNKKAAKSDFIINNDSNFASLKSQVTKIANLLQNRRKRLHESR